MPPVIPDHDVAFFAIGEADPPEIERLRRLFAAWPRPVLNDPAFLPDGHTRTFGEMTSIEKHGLPPLGLGLSHRARAFVKLAEICL